MKAACQVTLRYRREPSPPAKRNISGAMSRRDPRVLLLVVLTVAPAALGGSLLKGIERSVRLFPLPGAGV